MIKALLWGTDDMFHWLMSHYLRYISAGEMEIAAIAILTNGGPQFRDLNGNFVDQNTAFDRIILSTKNHLMARMADLERRGLPRKIIIDGKVFAVSGFDFKTFIEKGVVQGRFPSKSFTQYIIVAAIRISVPALR